MITESIFGLIGVIVGGVATFYGSYYSMKLRVKHELLREQRIKMEQLLSQCCFHYGKDAENQLDLCNIFNDFRIMEEFFHSHQFYFNDQIVSELSRDLVYINEIVNSDHHDHTMIEYYCNNFNEKFKQLIIGEIRAIRANSQTSSMRLFFNRRLIQSPATKKQM